MQKINLKSIILASMLIMAGIVLMPSNLFSQGCGMGNCNGSYTITDIVDINGCKYQYKFCVGLPSTNVKAIWHFYPGYPKSLTHGCDEDFTEELCGEILKDAISKIDRDYGGTYPNCNDVKPNGNQEPLTIRFLLFGCGIEPDGNNPCNDIHHYRCFQNKCQNHVSNNFSAPYCEYEYTICYEEEFKNGSWEIVLKTTSILIKAADCSGCPYGCHSACDDPNSY